MIVIERRFNGPPNSANGGYAAGVAARLVDGPAEVTLRLPPPLDTALDIKRDGDRVLLVHESDVVMEARPAAVADDPPPFVPVEQARAAQRRPEDLLDHVFPTCFVCGPARDDGLGIFVGPVPGTDLVAATWTPDASVADGDVAATEIMWAALDCPSGWTVEANNATGNVLLLGRITARILRPARTGEQVVVTAAPRAVDRRKHHAVSAVYSADGELLAHATSVWIAVD